MTEFFKHGNMTPGENSRRSAAFQILTSLLRDLRDGWKRLALTDLAYKSFAFVVLTPLIGILSGSLLALSGRSFLADEDILYFFLGPVGWGCFILIGALSLGILAIEQVALLGIVAAQAHDRELPVL
jgi:glycerophosphoryl diester phosphodiesterase